MSKYTEEELNQALEDTGRLLQDVPLTREYDLDDILAEFGTGAVKPPQPSRSRFPSHSSRSRKIRLRSLPRSLSL